MASNARGSPTGRVALPPVNGSFGRVVLRTVREWPPNIRATLDALDADASPPRTRF